VYLYRDRAGRVIYVGRRQVASSAAYVQGSSAGQAQDRRPSARDPRSRSTSSRAPRSSLILENNLIKKDRPRFTSACATTELPVPQDDDDRSASRASSWVRRARLDGNAYFGPYVPARPRGGPSRWWPAIQVATCYLEDMDGTRPRPCLLYQLNQCLAVRLAGRRPGIRPGGERARSS